MRYPWMVVGCLILGYAMGLHADDQAFVDASRQVLNQYGSSVVSLTATAKIDIGAGKTQEERGRSPGVVIDANGLVVTALNRLDPTPLIIASIKQRKPSLNPSVNITDIKIVWADGEETPGRIVFKDPDLDLAFVLPEFPDGKSSPVTQPIPLNGNSSAQIFDRVVSLGRLEDRYQRKLVLVEKRIAAVIEKPRRLYYIQSSVPGAPIFTETGAFLGLGVTRFSKQEGPDSLRVFVLPVEDIRDVAAQAYGETGSD
ncbi:serine protease [Planctomycetota bacterium]